MVDAGGMFAAEIARMAGVRVPVIPMSHQYLVTQPLPRARGETSAHLPTLRDPDLLDLLPRGRRRAGDGRLRAAQRAGLPARRPGAASTRIPPDFNGRLLEEDWDRFEEIIENSKRRVPAMDEITVTKLINGPEAFTPDNEFCLGETEVGGFFVCAGFCAHGLAGAGGIGKVMAEWIAEGEPSLDLWQMDIRRFGAQYRSPAYTHARIKENYETYYDIRYPNHERQRRAAAAGLAGQRLAPRARAPPSARSRAGSGSTGTSSNAAAGDEGAAPARLGRPALVAGDRRRAPRDPRGGGALRRVLVRQARDRGRRRRRVPRRPLRQPRRPRGRADHLHADAQPPRRDRVRLHRRPPRRGALLDRHRHRLRQPRPRVDAPPPARRRRASGSTTSPRSGPASGSGGRGRATCWRR